MHIVYHVSLLKMEVVKMSDSNSNNILYPLVESICECGNLLWKLISNNPNRIDWRAEFLALEIKNK